MKEVIGGLIIIFIPVAMLVIGCYGFLSDMPVAGILLWGSAFVWMKIVKRALD